MTEPLRVLAFVNWGRWVADCAVCPSAMALQPGQTRFVCGDQLCGAEAEIDWPASEQLDVATVDQLLGARPNPRNRNWHPWETAADLLVENIEHGVMPVKGLT